MSNPLSRAGSRVDGSPTTSHVLGVPISPPPDTLSDSDEGDSDREDHGRVGAAVKGFLGKLRSRHHSGRQDTASHPGSTDDVSPDDPAIQ